MVNQIVDNEVNWGPGSQPELAIRAKIASGHFQPNEHLVERDLCRMLGVGRASIRTALARLEQDGLVLKERNRGVRVRLIPKNEAVEILEARAALESMAVRYSALRADERDIGWLREVLESMRALLDINNLQAVSSRNAALHQSLLAMSGHLIAQRLIDTLKWQLVRFQYRTILIPGRSEKSFAEHTAIVDAVADHDPDRAEQAMKTHLLHVAEALRQDPGG
jgi:DNA-binding GntR family transcriptional regulator